MELFPAEAGEFNVVGHRFVPSVIVDDRSAGKPNALAAVLKDIQFRLHPGLNSVTGYAGAGLLFAQTIQRIRIDTDLTIGLLHPMSRDVLHGHPGKKTRFFQKLHIRGEWG